MRYEVQTRFWLNDWENCWTEDEKPWYFNTAEEAQAAIDEFIEDVKQAVADGDMEEEYDPEDYRVMEVDV